MVPFSRQSTSFGTFRAQQGLLCPAVIQVDTESVYTGPPYLNIVYKSDFHAGGNFAGVHAEGKHVIQGSSHVSHDLSPSNPDTGALAVERGGSDLWWRACALQEPL